MITSLKVKNYALIENLEISFSEGFSTITGETGAGKSILMGALSLILGQRADISALKQKGEKCVVEGSFRVGEPFRDVFEQNDLDFEPESIFRREISPAGKSRSFINDTPVTLQVMKELGTRLVDIHSQHQNLQLNDQQYQLEVVDFVAGSFSALMTFRESFGPWVQKKQELARRKEEYSRMKEDLDFMQFQFAELDAASLKGGEMEDLESELNTLQHAEEIKNALYQSLQLLSNEGAGASDQLKEIVLVQQKLARIFAPSSELAERFESVYIEAKDLMGEIEQLAEKADLDPERMSQLQERLDLLYGLMQKHRVKSLEDLINLRDTLDEKITEISLSDDTIKKLETEIDALTLAMEHSGNVLHKLRMDAGNSIREKIVRQLVQLGIPNARFEVRVEKTDTFDRNGCSRVSFMFSANKQAGLEEISRVASGGEVSRLMLSIKSLLSDHKDLPTLIFDEIDAGVSGEIAEKVGSIMNDLSAGRQVIAITHLPQVASQGNSHFLVYKEDTVEATVTRIKRLSAEERITEIAKMLSGEEVTNAAISNARALLKV